MKLLNKTRRTYFIYSAIIFVLSSTTIFFVLKRVMAQRQDEKLLWDKELIAQRLKYDYPLPILEVDDYELDYPVRDTLYFKDTMLYQIIGGVENYELYRQLTSIETLQGKTYKIVTRSSQVKNHEFILAITISVAVVVFLLILSAYILNTYVAKKFWNPFYKNLDKLKNYSFENAEPIALEESQIDEFKELNHSLYKLTDKLSTDFQNLKEFTENASHEMQTPLAIIQSKLEYLMQSENLNIEDKQTISTVFSASKRLSKLNKTLLMLSKIENQQYSQKKEILVNEIVNQQLEIFEDFILSKDLTISKNLTLDAKVNANPLLLDMVVSNLISNAIKHNQEGGSIEIHTNEVYLSVANTGKPTKTSSDMLFDRFKKESTSSDSFGLGLAIVKKICDVHEWKINHHYSEGLHHFTIYF
ncbi:sensor histidine kinase [Namhaeicola litoreus]|uniref:histidine kinase n=1 Tax=Namhaeicola litoreus TaxID=1052145 RepID=A0ABW3XX48_9FLAO